MISERCVHMCHMKGCYIAASSITDSQIIFYSPAGCEKNVLQEMAGHDILGMRHKRATLCQIGDCENVMGGDDKLLRIIRKTAKEHKSAHIFIIPSCAPMISCEDINGIIKASGESERVTLLECREIGSDLWKGFAGALKSIALDICKAEACGKIKGSVNIIGYMADRDEMDNKANIQCLKDMVKAAGLALNINLGGNAEFKELLNAGNAERNIVFPFGREAAAAIAKTFSQENIFCELPIGIAMTSRFMEDIGGLAYVNKTLGEIVPRIAAAREFLRMKKIAIFSDSAKMPGLLDFSVDLGLVPILAVTHDSISEGEANRLCEIGKSGLNSRPKVNPQEAIRHRLANEADIIIGSSVELHRYAASKVLLLSYPSLERHHISIRPLLGYDGALALAEDLMNLASLQQKRSFGLLNETSKLGFDEKLWVRKR